MSTFMRSILVSALLMAFFIAGCSNGDDYLYEEDETLFIEVSTEMAYSFDSSSARMKADTLKPGDSIIFIANILPSKSIKIKRYLWTLDGEPLSYDFSFRKNIEKPGFHRIAFILETYLGDTLSDTLTLQVSNPPVLDESRFIPAAGSQGLPTEGGISFAWNAYDPDSIANILYRFTIDGHIDTLVSTNGFTYWEPLPPLSHFYWSVQAINEFGIPSEEVIHGDFFTRGGPEEAGFTGYLGTSARASSPNGFPLDFNIAVLDTFGRRVHSSDIPSNSQNIQKFTIMPLESGRYKAVFSIPEYPDFASDTLDITLNAGEVLDLDTIFLSDRVAPKIHPIVNGIELEDTDTLKYADTLKFYIKDLGTPLSQKNVTVYIESTLITDKTSSGDTLTVVLPSTMRSWNTRLLDIVAVDASKNKSVRNFVLKDGDTWIITNKDQTRYPGETIRIYIVDENRFGFSTSQCTFDFGTNILNLKTNGNAICSTELDINTLAYGENEITSTLLYTNGITQSVKWTLTKIDSTGGNP